jgi:hypothetical protein
MSNSITEQTPIKLGLLLAVFSVSAASILGACWWAASWTSTVNVKLDNILLQQAGITTANGAIIKDVEDLKAWRKLIDTVGSPTVYPQLQEIKLQILEIRKEIEAHTKATTKP